MWVLPTQISFQSFIVHWLLHWIPYFMRWWWWDTPTSSSIRMHWMIMVISMVHGMACWIYFTFFCVNIMTERLMIHWSMRRMRGSSSSLVHKTRMTTWGTTTAGRKWGSHASHGRSPFVPIGVSFLWVIH